MISVEELHFICDCCGTPYPVDTQLWRCTDPACLGNFLLKGGPRFDPGKIRQDDFSLWRYRDLLPLPTGTKPVSLGEGGTPLISHSPADDLVLYKLEFMAPTGSFKDRGFTTLVSGLAAQGVQQAVEDSSGNAAASFAAYAARGGLKARVFAPASASPAKLAQVRIYGAALELVPGSREMTTEAAHAAVAAGARYASHVHHPFMMVGLRTFAWEIWEQMGKKMPDAIVCPVGQGGLLLGAYEGALALREAGLIDRLPRIFGVQTAACDPMVRAFEEGEETAAPLPPPGPQPTRAEGIRIAAPMRSRMVLRVARETGGAILRVPEEAILEAQKSLALQGLFVEPTSAVVMAARPAIRAILGLEAQILLALTGSGLKSGAPV
ncbi:MAG: pyridoxal-phosphate dependent enzyme [Chloroflexi bacterium]|nr:pyridoxal-phosphate dependent enzyme [Chloroflexota bacterium]